MGDFNGDGDPDLAVANQAVPTTSRCCSAVPAAVSSARRPTSPSVSAPTSVAVGDFNGDNDPDLAVANQFDGTVSVLLGTPGAGAFSGRPSPATTPAAAI